VLPLSCDGLPISAWNLLITVLIVFNAVYGPYRVAFIEQESRPMEILSVLVDFFFLVDIGLTFITDYYSKEQKRITNLRLIAINYLKTTFVPDIIAAVPYSVIDITNESDELMSDDWLKLSKLSRLYKITRIFRLIKLAKIAR